MGMVSPGDIGTGLCSKAELHQLEDDLSYLLFPESQPMPEAIVLAAIGIKAPSPAEIQRVRDAADAMRIAEKKRRKTRFTTIAL